MELSNLVGKHILSGIELGERSVTRYGYTADANFIRFTLDGVTYEAVEDPDDGYRSYMEDLTIVKDPCKIKLPDIEVCCHMLENGTYSKNDVLVFVDTMSGKEILAVGTANTDDYYPYCVLKYTPENMFCNKER